MPLPEPLHRIPPRTWWYLSLAAVLYLTPLAVFTALAEDVAEGEILPFDRPVMLWLHAHADPTLTAFFRVFTQLGGVVVVPVLATALAVALWWRHRRPDAVLVAASSIGAALANLVLKAIFKRTRPDFWSHLVVENSYSFPSGHAMGSAALATACVALAWHTRHRWTSLVVAVVYVVGVGVSRMYLGVHFPSDVLAGWCASAVWVAMVVAASRRARQANDGRG